MIKEIVKHIKHGDLIRTIKKRRYIKKNILNKNVTDEEYLVGLGKILLGYKMDLKNPKTFNEWINWYKLNYKNDLMGDVVDKIEVKKYIKSKGLEDIIIPTIKEYDSLDQIKKEELPEKFIIKNTLDSGGSYICKNKSDLSVDKIKEKLGYIINNGTHEGKHWALENVYSKNKNKIIVEELLETPDGTSPWDYKFFCFNGEPKYLCIIMNREKNPYLDYFDIEFNHIECKCEHENSKIIINKPENYDRMLEICRILAKDFPHVRVDLYNIDGKIFFGELTFYPAAGMGRFEPYECDLKFGEFFNFNIDKGEKS